MAAETVAPIEDLEDGEIESDGEETADLASGEKNEDIPPLTDETFYEKKSESKEFYSKSGKKKKSKSHKGEQKSKEKRKKNRNNGNPNEEDFAGNIEKAIKKAMNKNDDEMQMESDLDDRRKNKKRKKYDKDGPSRKRKKQEYSDEMDEIEMMCVRGASPVQKQSPIGSYIDDERDSYGSDSSQDDRQNQQQRKQRQRPQRDRNKNNNKNDRRRGAHPMQDPDGVCVYYMQGKCHKGDDCIYSHDAQPPRKMELCKFYLMECCAKRDKCLYMHADFPCKYYHTGLACIYKDECKFAHGKPLSENLKNILLKHIESAPKEILGDFPRLNREGALKMIQSTQLKLMQQFPEYGSENNEKNIPSLFEINVYPQNIPESPQANQFCNERQKGISPKVRHSRWQNDNSNVNSSSTNTATTNVLNIKNLNGVLTPRQISDLSRMGIENLDQLGQLTVLQLNSIGISLKQITEIQLNTMNIQKLGLITNSEQPLVNNANMPKDLDLRVPPPVAISTSIISSDLAGGRDVDMRFQPSVSLPTEDISSDKLVNKDVQTSKDNMIDIDQYTKDALKFASKDKENIDISNEKGDDRPVTIESKDIDHRVLPFAGEVGTQNSSAASSDVLRKENDTDIRFLQPEPIFKNPEKRHRRSTTDDEDNNLLIDEKWYSSDEEKAIKRKSPASSPQQLIQSPKALAPHVIEPSTVLSKLGDLSKIDISEEVTKLLNTMKNNLNDNPKSSGSELNDDDNVSQKSRDPRSRRSPDKVESTHSNQIDSVKVSSKRPPKVSIYECIEGEPTDGRRRNDVDLRQPDYKMPSFGDTDLRPGSSGDIDFRLSLPFKPIPNFTPASEIDGSINSHPPIPFRLVSIHIPRPDYTDIKNSTAKSQALVDPRLRKVFRLSLDESNSDSEKPNKALSTPTGPRVDPRRKKESTDNISEQKTSSLDLQTILQNSNWYKDLSTTQKIFVNQNLAPITHMIKMFQQEKIPGKKFDLTQVQGNTILGNIFTSLCVTLGDNGEFSYLPKPKEALLKTPVNYNQNIFGMNSNVAMDGNNMNMMNASMGMGNMNVGPPMHGYNQSYSDPRGGPQPGLLGIAPNIPHNFNNQFGGPNNNFGNMGYNGQGPENDFNFMEGNPNFQRFPNRGGHRGRGNDRWNRGGGLGRGHRDRKNFDRGNWKN